MAFSGKRKRRRLQTLCESQSWKCAICDMPMMSPVPDTCRGPNRFTATLDHIVPRCEKVDNRIENLRAAHAACNSSRNHGLPKSERIKGMRTLINRLLQNKTVPFVIIEDRT